MKEVKAVAKNVRSSARKARIPADAVRGMNALYALDVLKFTPKKAAHDVRKVVASAVANAVNNEEMKAEDLTISKVFVDEAFTYKRWRPESKGRARGIMKRNCHITVYVTDQPQVDSKAAKAEQKQEQKAEEKKEEKPKAAKKETKKAEKKPKAEKKETKKTTKPKTSKTKKA